MEDLAGDSCATFEVIGTHEWGQGVGQGANLDRKNAGEPAKLLALFVFNTGEKELLTPLEK